MSLKHLHAPWRKQYFTNKTQKCVFCAMSKNFDDIKAQIKNDDENFILFRAKHCFGVMNLYPYVLGEFMVIPYTHIDNIENLDEKIWFEMSYFVRVGVGVLKSVLNAGGVNIGMNLGAAAGAGIAEHVHYHLVPRYARDTNFITTIANSRVHGAPFMDEYLKLKEAFKDFNL